MVETADQFVNQILRNEAAIFRKTGRDDIEWFKVTVTTDEMGRASSIIDQSPTILIGDIQALTAADSLILDQGIAKTGDLKLYTDFDVNDNLIQIRNHDKIKVDDRTYDVITKTEEVIQGKEKVHNVYLLRLRP